MHRPPPPSRHPQHLKNPNFPYLHSTFHLGDSGSLHHRHKQMNFVLLGRSAELYKISWELHSALCMQPDKRSKWNTFPFLGKALVLGQEAFGAEHLGQGTDMGREVGYQADRIPPAWTFFSRSQIFKPPKFIYEVKSYSSDYRYINLYIRNPTH